MATKKTNPPNLTAGRRPLDSIDSLHPSSLPPELGSLDMSWDDDPRSVGAIDLLELDDSSLEMDAGERTTAIPEIPMAQLVEATMAEADAREAQSDRGGGVSHDPERWHSAPTATNNAKPTPPRDPEERRQGGDLSGPLPTQPAPARYATAPGMPAPQFGTPHSRDGNWESSAVSPSSQRDPNHPNRYTTSDPPLTSRSMAGPTGPNSSRPPPGTLPNRMSAPPTTRRTDTDGVRHQMKDRYATGDFSGALELAEALLEADTGDLEAQRFATSCRDVLTQMLTSRVGSFEQVVEVALTPEELRWLTLDHRAGFFLSLVDGSSTIEELLDISGMPRLESLRILTALLDQRVLCLGPH